VISCEVSVPWQEQNTDRQPLRMNWVVVTGKNGSRVLRMQWAVADRTAEIAVPSVTFP
jgi:hypothetical protein